MNKQEHKGLGDTVAAIAKATKLDIVAQKVAEIAGMEDCGCAQRREKLNKAVPYGTKVPSVEPPRKKQ